jgi:hypothetical protein
MTVISYTEDWKARESEQSLQDGVTGTRFFNVYSDTANETEATIYSALPVILGDTFPGTLTSQCVSQRAARLTDDRTVWTVTCQYKSVLNQIEQSRIDHPNPLDRTARITWGSRTVMTSVTRMQQGRTADGYFAYQNFDPADVTFDGKPYSVANCASDPFDPALEVPVTQWIASITKNVTNPPAWFMTYNNAVNNADVTLDGLTLKKGCGKLEDIRLSERMKENGYQYRNMMFNIICAPPRELRTGETTAPEPWDIEVLNEGMRYITSGSGGDWRNFKDITGVAVNKPIPLDHLGQPIDPSGNPIPEASLYWCLFRPFVRKDFSVLPLT